MQIIDNEIIECEDGSKTLKHSIIGDTYHSTKGSLAESLYVYIESGLDFINKDDITIFEVGFGTGINTILTLKRAVERGINISYYCVELYPISISNVEKLGLETALSSEEYSYFLKLHECEWNKTIKICENFSITKIYGNLLEVDTPKNIDLIYHDAFAFDSQPELWSEDLFKSLFNSMNPDGVLVTYASKGVIKQNLRGAGFDVKRLKGALGKHHMVRAVKYAQPENKE